MEVGLVDLCNYYVVGQKEARFIKPTRLSTQASAIVVGYGRCDLRR